MLVFTYKVKDTETKEEEEMNLNREELLKLAELTTSRAEELKSLLLEGVEGEYNRIIKERIAFVEEINDKIYVELYGATYEQLTEGAK